MSSAAPSRNRTTTYPMVEIRPHPTATVDPCWIGIVTTVRHLCYYCTWTRDSLDEATVLQAWRQDRRAFLPWTPPV